MYPEHVLDLIGRSDLAKHDQRYTDLFSAGVTCLDDPQGTIYPPMHEIMERFFSRYKVVVEAVKGVDDSAFLKDNPHPSDRMRSMLPTLGKMVAFMLDGHCHSHLGQVSTWRRCMGLPSAF